MANVPGEASPRKVTTLMNSKGEALLADRTGKSPLPTAVLQAIYMRSTESFVKYIPFLTRNTGKCLNILYFAVLTSVVLVAPAPLEVNHEIIVH